MAQVSFNRDQLRPAMVTGSKRTVVVVPNGASFDILEQGGAASGKPVAEFIDTYEEAVRKARSYANGGAVINDPAYRVVNTNGLTLY